MAKTKKECEKRIRKRKERKKKRRKQRRERQSREKMTQKKPEVGSDNSGDPCSNIRRRMPHFNYNRGRFRGRS